MSKILRFDSAGDILRARSPLLDVSGASTAARAREARSPSPRVPRTALLEGPCRRAGALTLGLLQHVLAHLRKANDLVVREVVHKEKLSLVGRNGRVRSCTICAIPYRASACAPSWINSTPAEGKIPQWCDGIRLQCDAASWGMAAELMEFSNGESKLAPGAGPSTTAFLGAVPNPQRGMPRARPESRFVLTPSRPTLRSIHAPAARVLQNLDVTTAVEALHATPVSTRIGNQGHWVKDSRFLSGREDRWAPGFRRDLQRPDFRPFVNAGKKSRHRAGPWAICSQYRHGHGGPSFRKPRAAMRREDLLPHQACRRKTS